jgi:hypothetical protein
VKDFASKSFRGRHEFAYMSRLSRLPTEPEALRLKIENRRGGSSPVDPSPADSPRGGATVARLLNILSEPLASPALRAAVFNALAEIPGIGLERDVADVAGRRGDAIGWSRSRAGLSFGGELRSSNADREAILFRRPMSQLECPSCRLRIKALGAPVNCPRCLVRKGERVELSPGLAPIPKSPQPEPTPNRQVEAPLD